MAKLRFAFMGTPDFAVPALLALAAAHEVIAVYTQPPKPAGRGYEIQKSSIHKAAEKLGIPVHTPKTLRDKDAQAIFTDLKLDMAVVAAYGLILPIPILMAPTFGCINIHASLLPRWRGAAPIQRSLLAGDTKTGITIMQMAEGLDTGAILMQDTVPISVTTTASVLHDALAEMGARMIVPAVEALSRGQANPQPQPEDGVTYAAKLTKEDGRIDWTQPALDIERHIRALQPWPGSFFMLGQEAIKVLSATVIDKTGTPGTLLDDHLTIATGQKSLQLQSVQRAGKKPTEGASLLRGLRLLPGHNFGTTR